MNAVTKGDREQDTQSEGERPWPIGLQLFALITFAANLGAVVFLAR